MNAFMDSDPVKPKDNQIIYVYILQLQIIINNLRTIMRNCSKSQVQFGLNQFLVKNKSSLVKNITQNFHFKGSLRKNYEH